METHFEGGESWGNDGEDVAMEKVPEPNGWRQIMGEVVIVKIAKKVTMPNKGWMGKFEYQRARITYLTERGAFIELLDDYGMGGVRYERLFEMRPEFAIIPPQVRCIHHNTAITQYRNTEDIFKYSSLFRYSPVSWQE